MGVTRQSFDFLSKWLDPEQHKSVCELGDQQFLSCPPFIEKSHTRTYFNNLGLEYDCVDMNGMGKCIMMDLNKDNEIVYPYDFVTDFGTLEHVNDFYMGFKNMHNLCKAGGIMLHVLPAFGHWPNHGTWRVKMDFFAKLRKSCDYVFKFITVTKTIIGGDDSDQIYVVLEKQYDEDFISREKFDSLGPIQAYDFEEYNMGKVSEWGKSLYE